MKHLMHTILWSRGGSHDGVDWDDEQTVTFDADLKVIALHPGAGNHGVRGHIALHTQTGGSEP